MTRSTAGKQCIQIQLYTLCKRSKFKQYERTVCLFHPMNMEPPPLVPDTTEPQLGEGRSHHACKVFSRGLVSQTLSQSQLFDCASAV